MAANEDSVEQTKPLLADTSFPSISPSTQQLVEHDVSLVQCLRRRAVFEAVKLSCLGVMYYTLTRLLPTSYVDMVSVGEWKDVGHPLAYYLCTIASTYMMDYAGEELKASSGMMLPGRVTATTYDICRQYLSGSEPLKRGADIWQLGARRYGVQWSSKVGTSVHLAVTALSILFLLLVGCFWSVYQALPESMETIVIYIVWMVVGAGHFLHVALQYGTQYTLQDNQYWLYTTLAGAATVRFMQKARHWNQLYASRAPSA
ncbi:hypothetical protein RI367_008413 [Sorochytrium milnesiophthora]